MMPAQAPPRQTAEAEYQVSVKGTLSPRWVDWLGDMKIVAVSESSGSPVTVLEISVIDQAALLGKLQRLHNLGLTLLHVKLGRQCQRSDNDENNTE